MGTVQPSLREDDGVLEGANRLESAVPFIAGAGRFFDDHELVMPSAGGRRERGCFSPRLGSPLCRTMWGKSGAPGRPRCWGRLLMTILFRRHTLSIAARLTMLALSTALPLVALAGFFILRAVDDQRAQIQRDVRERVENLLANVDRQISAIQAELQVLAVSPSLQDGDLPAFDRQMRTALKIRGTSIVLLDPTHNS